MDLRARLAAYASGLRGTPRRWLPWVFVCVGAAVLAYVGFEYYDMYRSQKELAVEWERQNTTLTQRPVAVNDGLTRLEIPKIEMDAIVVDGTTRRDLKRGPGRIVSTALPGENGNSVITAHRDTFFRHIYELSKGDNIVVRRNGEQLTFAVTGKKIVDPDDLSVLKQTAEPTLTHITCYPTYYIGPAPQRLVVMSKLVERKPNMLATK